MVEDVTAPASTMKAGGSVSLSASKRRKHLTSIRLFWTIESFGWRGVDPTSFHSNFYTKVETVSSKVQMVPFQEKLEFFLI